MHSPDFRVWTRRTVEGGENFPNGTPALSTGLANPTQPSTGVFWDRTL